jgi:hypothetical protein
MSSGAFAFVGVELDDTSVARIRVQPETTGLVIGGEANDGVANPAGEADRILVSAGRRRRGVLISAKVRFRFSGTPPTGYLAGSTLTLPILNGAIAAQCDEGATGTYLGAAIVVSGYSPPIGYDFA